MLQVAHRGLISQENTVRSVVEATKIADIVEVDVRYTTNRNVVLCHDRERRNDIQNETLLHLISVLLPGQKLMIDIKAFGMTESKKLAVSVADIVSTRTDVSFYMCSFNEYCVDELLNQRDERGMGNWTIGVIASGIPLGMFEHLNIDFVSLDYNIVCEDVVERLHNRKIILFAWVVNDASMRRMMTMYNVDGIIYDF